MKTYHVQDQLRQFLVTRTGMSRKQVEIAVSDEDLCFLYADYFKDKSLLNLGYLMQRVEQLKVEFDD